MNILTENQYNQSVGKYKLLSSASGVGSIIATKMGFYILISDINKWKFINELNSRINQIRTHESNEKNIYNQSKGEAEYVGLGFVNDIRFVKFLKEEKNLSNLVCLVNIPQMSLNENINTPKWKDHPINKILKNKSLDKKASDYMVQGTHFPKWFKNDQGELKDIEKWKQLWSSKSLKYWFFAPPRDAGTPMKNSKGELITVKRKDENGVTESIQIYKELTQTNLILICPNGHLSDVPWPNYLKWKTDKQLRRRPETDHGELLFSKDQVGPCCNSPKLKWTESKTKSEGFASIFIECSNCGLGTGADKEKPKINLEGINSLQPYCIGQKPWEIGINNGSTIPTEPCFAEDNSTRKREKMRVALVTANNVYYATGFSSIFIPLDLSDSKAPGFHDVIDLIQDLYNHPFNKSRTKVQFWNQQVSLDGFKALINDSAIECDNIERLYEEVRVGFLKEETISTIIDRHEHYRWQEYQCFISHTSVPDTRKIEGLKFNEIDLPKDLSFYFTKIQQVEQLKVTNVQLDFSRVSPKERIVVNGEVKESKRGKNIFSCDSNELFVLPANETLGEGLFFQFSDNQIEKWILDNKEILSNRFTRLLVNEPDLSGQGVSTKRKIFNNGVKHFLIHTFSHILMRELEFSCGYPTASLKERLYISSNPEKLMSGVLIYTAEGSEGSMGGLVSQGEPDRIREIILKGLERSYVCSSDPLCWESEGQGIFDLNLSACFSCSLVSETACEEMNLGLDRRVLIDQDFGFFKQMFPSL